MRTPIEESVAGYRIAKRYRKLHVPLIELMQTLQDLAPNGMVLNNEVTLSRENGYINIKCTAKPIRLTLEDGEHRFTLQVEKMRPKSRKG